MSKQKNQFFSAHPLQYREGITANGQNTTFLKYISLYPLVKIRLELHIYYICYAFVFGVSRIDCKIMHDALEIRPS